MEVGGIRIWNAKYLIKGKGGYVTGQVPVQYHDVEAGLALAGAGSWRSSLIENY